MPCRRYLVIAGIVLAFLLLDAPAALAEKTPVKPTQEWSGSVEDETLEKAAPTSVTTAKGLEKLWQSWKLADKPPAVDFTKELVVLTTTRGGRVRLITTLDEKGNLQVDGLATRDLRLGFRYVIATVPRDGVKTINGKELPAD